MDTQTLIRVHLELECVGIDPNQRLFRIPCDNPDDLPRFYIAEHNKGFTRYTSRDLPEALRAPLLALAPEVALHEIGIAKSILEADAPCEGIHTGKSYVFPETITKHWYPDVVQLGEQHRHLIAQYNPRLDPVRRTIFAMITDGKIISTCESSRENEHAGEAWVQTLPEYRGRGYARQVTAAWGHQLQNLGKLPFYSHKHINLASESLARSLKLIQFVTDTVYP